jgi:hypothetical protein
MKPLRVAMLLWLAACGSPSGPLAHVTGQVDLSTFPQPTPTSVEATDQDGHLKPGTLSEDGRFDLRLAPDHTWSFRVVFEGGGYPIALPREGHFDRALVAMGQVEAPLGEVWLPPAGSSVTALPQSESARCPAGRLEDGTPCAVDQVQLTCTDFSRAAGPAPAGLLLGNGSLADLPGAARGVRYAIPSRVPPPVVMECTGQ